MRGRYQRESVELLFQTVDALLSSQEKSLFVLAYTPRAHVSIDLVLQTATRHGYYYHCVGLQEFMTTPPKHLINTAYVVVFAREDLSDHLVVHR